MTACRTILLRCVLSHLLLSLVWAMSIVFLFTHFRHTHAVLIDNIQQKTVCGVKYSRDALCRFGSRTDRENLQNVHTNTQPKQIGMGTYFGNHIIRCVFAKIILNKSISKKKHVKSPIHTQIHFDRITHKTGGLILYMYIYIEYRSLDVFIFILTMISWFFCTSNFVFFTLWIVRGLYDACVLSALCFLDFKWGKILLWGTNKQKDKILNES